MTILGETRRRYGIEVDEPAPVHPALFAAAHFELAIPGGATLPSPA